MGVNLLQVLKAQTHDLRFRSSIFPLRSEKRARYSPIHVNSVDGFFGSEARMRLYQRRFLRPRRHFSVFFELHIFSFAPFQISVIFQNLLTPNEKTVDRITVNLKVEGLRCSADICCAYFCACSISFFAASSSTELERPTSFITRAGPRPETIPNQGSRALIILRTWRGVFSAVSKPNFASKCSFSSVS